MTESEFREWDWPPYPERHGASRRGYRSGPDRSQPVLDLHVQVTRGAAGYRKRSLYDRFLSAYARVIIGALRIVVGAALGVAVVLAAWFVVTVIRHL
jgi:hypothetical protein